ncbi:MAG: hypothetical protein COA41_01865 [Sphingopyxis sp.]|nr:MAG: hypothetical protein COA41_01865 [Sphingopyxis sp.]
MKAEFAIANCEGWQAPELFVRHSLWSELMSAVRLKPKSVKNYAVLQSIRLSGAILSARKFRGFYTAAKILGKFSGDEQHCEINIGKGSRYAFRLADPYWARLVYGGFEYESELRSLFARLGDMSFSFFDCGANLGYWSIYCAEFKPNCKAIFTVEASPLTFKSLERNRDINLGKFEIMLKAIYSTSGEYVHIECSQSNHAGAGIVDVGATNTASIETITIDDLVDQDNSGAPPVIKLDVEGAEIPALRGALKTIGGNCLLAFEDHGNDHTCKVIAHLLGNTDLNIYFLDKSDTMHPIKSIGDAQKFKVDDRVGYNFFATQPGSDFMSIFQN